MKSKLSDWLAVSGMALALCAPLALLAQEEEKAQPDLADLWVVHVKAGHEGDFETQFKAHLAVRKEAGDPRSWNVYTPVIGDDIGYYAIRFCCTDWAGLDAYDSWSLAASDVQQHWNENVHPHVTGYEHYLHQIDYDNSHWPEENPGFQYFGVSSWDIKPGGYAAMNEARVAMSEMAKEHGWPRYWSWLWPIGGRGGLELVSPFVNYAGMAPPEPSFAEFAAEHMGEEAGKVLSAFSSNLTDGSYTVYRLRQDLSGTSE